MNSKKLKNNSKFCPKNSGPLVLLKPDFKSGRSTESHERETQGFRRKGEEKGC